MSFEQVVFYIFASVMIFAALGVIASRNPVHSAMSLVLAFFTSAALWILLEAEFLGIVLVLVYVGAVMVLFLFVIMMLDINFDKMREGLVGFLPVTITVGLVVLIEMVFVLKAAPAFKMAAPPPAAADESNTEALGLVLYTEYVYPFEIAAVILVVAIIAAIVLTLRRRSGSETLKQDIGKQVRVKREDRVRLVKMKAEKKGEQS